MKYFKTILIVVLLLIILLLSKCSSDYKSEITTKNDYIEYLENNNKSLNICIDSLNATYLSREKTLVTELDGVLVVNKKLHAEITQLKKLTGNNVVAATDIVIENNTALNDTIWLNPVDMPDMTFRDEYIGPMDSIYKQPYTVYYKIYYDSNKEGIIIDTIKSQHELKVFLDDNANVNVITENGSQVVELESYLDPKQLKKLSKKYNKNNFNVSVGLGASLIATPEGPKFGPGVNVSIGKTIFSW